MALSVETDARAWATQLTAEKAATAEVWPPKAKGTYNWKASTSENYHCGCAPENEGFAEGFQAARVKLDYSYHRHPLKSRQALQDAILTRISSGASTSSAQPWVVFTAGAMGVGKSYVLLTLYNRRLFPLDMFTRIDPDLIKNEIPELIGYMDMKADEAATQLHRESTQMADVLFEHFLMNKHNILVDGSLRDVQWYKTLFARIRTEFPKYRIAILQVEASRETIFARAKARGDKTGRVVPEELLEQSIKQVPESVATLGPLADAVSTVSNENGADIALTGAITSWKEFMELWSVCTAHLSLKASKSKADLKDRAEAQRKTTFGEEHNLSCIKAAQKLYCAIYPNTCTRCMTHGHHELRTPCVCYQRTTSWKVKVLKALERQPGFLSLAFRLGAYDWAPKTFRPQAGRGKRDATLGRSQS